MTPTYYLKQSILICRCHLSILLTGKTIYLIHALSHCCIHSSRLFRPILQGCITYCIASTEGNDYDLINACLEELDDLITVRSDSPEQYAKRINLSLQGITDTLKSLETIDVVFPATAFPATAVRDQLKLSLLYEDVIHMRDVHENISRSVAKDVYSVKKCISLDFVVTKFSMCPHVVEGSYSIDDIKVISTGNTTVDRYYLSTVKMMPCTMEHMSYLDMACKFLECALFGVLVIEDTTGPTTLTLKKSSLVFASKKFADVDISILRCIMGHSRERKLSILAITKNVSVSLLIGRRDAIVPTF